MNVHTRCKQYIGAFFFHFLGNYCIELFNKPCVERASQKCADRQKRATGNKPDSRRPVGCDYRTNTLITQAFKHTAVSTCVTLWPQRTVHFVVAPCDCLKLGVVKLCHKFVKGCLAVFNVVKFYTLVARLLNSCGQVVEYSCCKVVFFLGNML